MHGPSHQRTAVHNTSRKYSHIPALQSSEPDLYIVPAKHGMRNWWAQDGDGPGSYILWLKKAMDGPLQKSLGLNLNGSGTCGCSSAARLAWSLNLSGQSMNLCEIKAHKAFCKLSPLMQSYHWPLGFFSVLLKELGFFGPLHNPRSGVHGHGHHWSVTLAAYFVRRRAQPAAQKGTGGNQWERDGWAGLQSNRFQHQQNSAKTWQKAWSKGQKIVQWNKEDV